MSDFYDAAESLVAATGASVYPRRGVPERPTYPYIVLSVVLGRGDGYTLDATHGLRWGRVVAQTFGHTDAGADQAAEQVIDALLDTPLGVDGWETTPCLLELDPTETDDPDDAGVAGRTLTLTFTAIKEA